MRIEVEPQQLIDAGKQVGSLGTQLGALSDAMGQVLSAGIASGADPAGLNFGISYGRQADEFGKQLAQLANAFKSVGLMLEATGFNYRSADAASTPGGPGPSGGISGEQAETKAGDAPYAPNGSIVPPPSKWWIIRPFLSMIPLFGAAMTWPSGNSAMMNLTAAQWSNIGRGLKVFEPSLTSAAMTAGAQDIPEVGQIQKALKDLGDGANRLAGFADQMGTTITEFARGVQETQDSIRRILDRLSLDGVWDTVTGFLTGDGDKILREIAEDVGNVLENFQNQVKGVLGLLEELKTLLGEAADAFEKWIRPILVETFGEQHGNFLADAIDFYTDVQVGGAFAVIGLVSGTVALADLDTWKGLADTALMIAKDPTQIDDVLKQIGSEFIALDEWQGDNPGRGLGEATGNIASLFLPGGPLAKGGSVAKGLAATRNLLDGGSPGGLGRLPGLDGRTPDMPELPDAPGAPDVPEFTPPPAIPGSVLNPGGPSGTTPTAPSSPGSGSGGGPAPTGPSSTSSGPSQSGGGAGPGSPSSNGPAPTGGSPSTGGSSGGPSSNGPAPVGGSPSAAGGDGPSGPSSTGSGPTGGAPLSPPISAPSDAPDSGGPSQSSSGAGPSGGGDGSGSQSSGGGSSSGGGPSGSGDGSGGPSPDDRASSPTGGSSSPDSSPSHTSGDGSPSEPDLKQGNPAQEATTGHQPNDGVGQSKDVGGTSGTSDPSGVSDSAQDAPASGGDGGGRSDPLHSGEQSGDGWRRLDNDEVDPSYGRHPLDEHWTYGDYPDAIAPEVRGLISDPDAPWGRDSEGNPLSQDQYESVYNKSGPNGDHWQNWPPNAGAVPETRLVYDRLDAFIRDFGTLDGNLGVDRIGKFEGDYLAVMPDGIPATFEQRSLPIYSLTQPYHQFEMSGDLPDGWTVEVSEVAPAFGRDGGGTQVRILDDDGNAVLIPRLKGLGILQ